MLESPKSLISMVFDHCVQHCAMSPIGIYFLRGAFKRNTVGGTDRMRPSLPQQVQTCDRARRSEPRRALVSGVRIALR